MQLFYTRKVRQALLGPAGLGVEFLLLALVAAVCGGIVIMGRQWGSPLHEKVTIDLSFSALPRYTLMSLGRGVAAYVLSLAFTLIYGTVAAHNHRAEKVMIPLLDVLQAIPVLGFLPALVLALIGLFPTRQIGLELACVVMIFTGQVWNMTFSYHGSVRGVPQALREVAAIQRLSGWQIFKWLELPASMIGLVWNSMMSMAGGWFFLTVTEAFQLGSHDYRLPGIGSYMQEAIDQGNIHAQIAAIIAMIVMIVTVDQVLWRPIVVWSQRFKMEDQSAADASQSWLMNLFRRSRLLAWLQRRWAHHSGDWDKAIRLRGPRRAAPMLKWTAQAIRPLLRWITLLALAVGVAWVGWKLLGLLWELPLYQWLRIVGALGASFLRTTGAVLLGAAWALPVGILIGRSPRWSNRLQPLVQTLASFPAPMLFPLALLLLSFLHVPLAVSCGVLMLLGSQWYILFNVIAGATSVPADLTEAARVNHLSQWEMWMRLYLPCVFPYLVTGLITAAGGAWNATIVAEYLIIHGKTVSTFGLGSLISKATNAADFPLLAASVITMAVFVVVLNRLVWKRLYRLAESRYSFNV